MGTGLIRAILICCLLLVVGGCAQRQEELLNEFSADLKRLAASSQREGIPADVFGREWLGVNKKLKLIEESEFGSESFRSLSRRSVDHYGLGWRTWILRAGRGYGEDMIELAKDDLYMFRRGLLETTANEEMELYECTQSLDLGGEEMLSLNDVQAKHWDLARDLGEQALKERNR